MHTSTIFVLRGGDAAFANRQKLLFNELLIAEGKHNRQDKCKVDNTVIQREADDSKCSVAKDNLKRKKETNKFRGKESIFKRPEGPAPRSNIRSIPDHHKNPHKWIKYSLDDVSIDDMTEQSNTQAAMSFLRELKARRKKEKASDFEEKMDVEPCELNTRGHVETVFKSKKHMSKIVFRKPQTEEASGTSQAIIIEPEERPVFRSSKVIMPEYVIGQKLKKVRKHTQPAARANRLKELKLDHLQEPDEEEQ